MPAIRTYVLIDFENVRPDLALLRAVPGAVALLFVGAAQRAVPLSVAIAMQRLGARAAYVRAGGAGPNALDFHLALYLGVLIARDPAARFVIVSRDAGFDPLIRHLRARRLHIRRVPDLAALLTADAPEATADAAPVRPSHLPPSRPPAQGAGAGNRGGASARPDRSPPPSPPDRPHPDPPPSPPDRPAPDPPPAPLVNRCVAAFLAYVRNPRSTRPGSLPALRNHIRFLAKAPLDDAAVAAVIAALQRQGIITVTAQERIVYAPLPPVASAPSNNGTAPAA